jgi:ubiquinone/menaquinone biosynthesis C-methylase UbiE
MKRIPAILLLAFVAFLPALAQEKSVRPDINKPFQNPDVPGFLKKFEVESREIYHKRAEIVKACGFKPGMAVADIGAGTGLFTRLFAREVGPKGTVYAVDISRRFLDHIAKTCKDAKIDNVKPVQCDQFSCKLPANSVDAVFICDTYHHFEFPQKTLATIHRALKPGGKLVLIDFKRIKGVTSERMMKHVRAGQEVFTAEVRAAGFTQRDELTLLKENYLVRFTKKERKG